MAAPNRAWSFACACIALRSKRISIRACTVTWVCTVSASQRLGLDVLQSFIQHMYSVLHVERSTITVLSQLRGLRLRYIEYLFKYIIFMLKIYYNSRLSGRQIDFGRQIDRQT